MGRETRFRSKGTQTKNVHLALHLYPIPSSYSAQADSDLYPFICPSISLSLGQLPLGIVILLRSLWQTYRPSDSEDWEKNRDEFFVWPNLLLPLWCLCVCLLLLPVLHKSTVLPSSSSLTHQVQQTNHWFWDQPENSEGRHSTIIIWYHFQIHPLPWREATEKIDDPWWGDCANVLNLCVGFEGTERQAEWQLWLELDVFMEDILFSTQSDATLLPIK